MGREVRIVLWCDACVGDDVETPEVGEAIIMQLGTLKAREVILCERHRKELFDPLKELAVNCVPADQVGIVQKPAGRPKSEKERAGGNIAGDFFCLMPECGKVYKRIGALREHVKNPHPETTWGDYKARASDQGILFNEQNAAPIGSDETFECEVCGQKYSHALGNNRPAQALGMHRRRAHGITK